eukprot:101383-Rhodomonas_salina.3
MKPGEPEADLQPGTPARRLPGLPVSSTDRLIIIAGGTRRVKSGERRAERGDWRLEGGGWKVDSETGEWRLGI